MATQQESVRRNVRKPLERVACRAYLSAQQSNLTGNAWNKIALNAVTYDLGKNFDTVTNNRFTVPVTGLYKVVGHIEFVGASVIADKAYGVGIYKNGVLQSLGYNQASFAGSFGVEKVDEIYLKEGDYVEMYCFPGVGGGTDTVDVLSGSDATSLVLRLVTKEGIKQ